MSPTLLEVTVAVLLLWVAWQVGLRIGPRLVRYLSSALPPRDPAGEPYPPRAEKNVTPRSDLK